MENRTDQLSEDEEVRFQAATVYDIKQEHERSREVGRVSIDIESEYPGSYVADGQRWLRVTRFYDEEAWYLLDSDTVLNS